MLHKFPCQNFDQAGEGETKLLLERDQKRDQAKSKAKFCGQSSTRNINLDFSLKQLPLIAPKMFNFAPKPNARYPSGIPFLTLMSFAPLPSASVRTVFWAYADLITKFSRIHRLPISFSYRNLLRARFPRVDASVHILRGGVNLPCYSTAKSCLHFIFSYFILYLCGTKLGSFIYLMSTHTSFDSTPLF